MSSGHQANLACFDLIQQGVTHRDANALNHSLGFPVLPIRLPSSFYSFTSRLGKAAGMMRRGLEPGTSAYSEKSLTPQNSLRNSSSNPRFPFTEATGALSIARTASGNIVCQLESASDVSSRVCTNRLPEFIPYCRVLCSCRIDCLLRSILQRHALSPGELTAAGQMDVTDISCLPCLSKSIASPLVNTDLY